MKRLLLAVSLLLFVAAWIVLAYIYFSRPPLNVVLVSIDTLRPDHLSCYGYSRATSPSLDRLALEGARFESAISTTSWTLPAHIALFTSLPDLVHGVLWDDQKLNENRITLAEILKESGYRTGGVFTGPYLLPRFGFEQGFDDYLDATLHDKKLVGPDVLLASEQGRTTPGAMEKVEAWIDQSPDDPFFLFLHLFDAHPDFDPPPPYDTMFDPSYSGTVQGKDVFHNPAIKADMAPRDLSHLKALYDGEIRFVDEAGISRLLAMLEERDLLDRTLIIITSDHGEEFFEHGKFGHRKNLYDTTLRIPLIFWRPGLVSEGVVIKDQVRIIDVMPTILDLLGLPPGIESLGQSLVPLMRGHKEPGAEPRPAFAELTGGNLHFEALRTGDFKVVLDYNKKSVQYFDLNTDPLELKPITDTKFKELRNSMIEFNTVRDALANCRKLIPWGESTRVEIDRETRERLKSLGYVE